MCAARVALSRALCNHRALKRWVSTPHTAPLRVRTAAVQGQGGDSFEAQLLYGGNLNSTTHLLWKHIVKPGDTVVDCTAGNGHDALYLAQLAVTATGGRLVAFDVQKSAVEATSARLQSNLAPEALTRCEVRLECHSKLAEHVMPNSVSLVAFNLGYLPGVANSPAQNLITKPETTIAALKATTEIIRAGGCISIMCYTGHEGGQQEADAVESLCAALPAHRWTVTSLKLVNRQAAPHLILAFRRE